jgi:hypothetical protein
MTSRHSLLLALAAAAVLGACGDDAPPPRTFLDGTASDPGILLAVNLDKALFMLQTGAPDQRVSIALGASATVTPVGLSVFGNYSAVPLGNVGSVAYVNLATETVDRYFTFPSGNATGSAFVNPSTVVVCNQTTDQCGKFDPAQVGMRSPAWSPSRSSRPASWRRVGGCSSSPATWTTATCRRGRAW